MRKRFNGKRGEMTTQQIVGLIILITSFAVILFLLARVNLQETAEKELCHNSIVMRSQSVLPRESFPLNCHTEYVCITADGSCEQMVNPEIEKIKTKKETYEALAEKIADCWWMFGEGKLDYLRESDLFQGFFCSICNQIAFDDSMKEIFETGKLSKKELYTFMSEEKISEKKGTYTEYLYNIKDISKICSKEKEPFCNGFGEISLEKQHYIMMGILEKRHFGTKVGQFIGVLGTAEAGAVVSSNSTGSLYISSVVEGESENKFLLPFITEVNSEEFKSIKCKDITTLS